MPAADLEVVLITLHSTWPSLHRCKQSHMNTGELGLDAQLVSYSVTVKGQTKHILHNISLYVQPHELCAIVGGSGAGKSTLLDLLAGRKKTGTWSGSISVGGMPQNGNGDAPQCAYVQQSDMHLPHLSVEETVAYSASLRLTAPFTDTERTQRVHSILDTLGLSHVRHNRVGQGDQMGLSGGQLKRLSIAVEIVTDQKILFLDEPTSGFDSSLSMEVITALKRLVSQNRCAVASIHQPSRALFALFDKVLVLADGRVVYCGATSKVVEYFTSPQLGYQFPGGYHNPCEFVLEICRGQALSAGAVQHRLASELGSLFQSSAYFVGPRPTAPSKDHQKSQQLTHAGLVREWLGVQYPLSTIKQIAVLVHRSWCVASRDVADWKSQLIKFIAVGLLAGCVYFHKGDTSTPLFSDGDPEPQIQSASSIMYQICVVVMYANNSAITHLASHMLHFRREQSAGVYSTIAFACSRLITAVPFVLLNYTVYLCIFYLMCDLPMNNNSYFYTMLISLCGSITSYAMVMALTANTSTAAYAYILFPAQADFFLTMSGYLIQIDNIPAWWRWATNISYGRWLYEGLMINHWNRFETDDYTGDAEDGNGDVLDLYDFSGFSKYDCIPLVVTFFAVAFAALYFGLLPPLNQLVHGSEAQVDGTEVSAADKRVSKATASSLSTLKEGLLLPEERAAAAEAGTSTSAASTVGVSNSATLQVPKLTVESFRASTGTAERAQGCRLTFQNVSFELPSAATSDKKTADYSSTAAPEQTRLLKEVSGMVFPGEMCALMGSSGAGKSTLLDVLAKRKSSGTITGNITYNGSKRLTSHAYVMQDDLHLAALTVKETLFYAAELRLPQSMSKEAKAKRVQQILNMLILGHVADSQVGKEFAHKISGGELKRLTIGVEIVHLPDLLFLDEPTTGLDSSTSLEIVSALRNIANQNRTIISTIHQPSREIFELFDTTLLLAEARVVYFGPTAKCVNFFTQSPFKFTYTADVDPADFLVAVASSSVPAFDGRLIAVGELAVYYSGTDGFRLLQTTVSNAGKQTAAAGGSAAEGGAGAGSVSVSSRSSGSVVPGQPAPPAQECHLTLWYQLEVLLGRRFLVMRREWRIYAWISVVDLLVSFFYASVWYQIPTGQASHVYTDRLGLLNKSNAYMTIKNMDPGFIMDDRRLHYRERRTNAYSVFAYWVSIWLPRMPLEILNSVLFTVFMYPMTNLRVGFVHYLAYLFMNGATNACSFLMFSTVAAISPTLAVAVSLTGLTQMLTMSLNGFGIYLPQMQSWMAWTTSLDFARFAMQGLVVNEFEDNSELPKGQKYIHMLGFEHLSTGDCAGVLFLFIGGYMAALYLALRYCDFDRR